jgi:dTDP-4-amino-4,6-dideoxygalactose transaminase
LIAHLKAQSILSVFHYAPLHLSEAGRRFAAGPSNCPVTEDLCNRVLRLPFYNDLSTEDQDHVTKTVRSFSIRSLLRQVI